MPEKEYYNHSRSQLLAQMDVAMGGRVAEELIYGMDKVTTGRSRSWEGQGHPVSELFQAAVPTACSDGFGYWSIAWTRL